MQCKYCLKDFPKLSKSHIIPKAFFGFAGGSEERSSSKLISAKEDVYAKNAPNGVYDSNILCAECEKKFSPLDDKAIKFFQKDLKNHYPTVQSHTFYKAPFYDYKNLKLFFLSVLWRAHHSNHYFYESVNLGEKHESRLKEILITNDVQNFLEYPIYLNRFNTNRPAAYVIPNPAFIKNRGDPRLNYYLFTFAAHQIFIKVDERNLPSKYHEVLMEEGKPLAINFVPLEKSPHFQKAVEMARAQANVKFRN